MLLDEVFGVSRDLPVNYVVREGVDGEFVNNLARDKHIVVFGSSKQGKTSLRKHSLDDDDYVVVTCSNKWTSLALLHTAILKAVGYVVEQSTAKTAEGTNKVVAKLEGQGGVPFLAKAKAAGEAGHDSKSGQTVTTAPLELDPGDVNDIIAALKSIDFQKFIVLEDFHYLPEETQQDFSVALKAFHEGSDLTFIVVGVWLDENRLLQYNGDLTERVVGVNADAWSPEQLGAVISKGEELLNIEFDSGFRAGLISGCFESVSVVQMACHMVCEAEGVTSTRRDKTVVGSGARAQDVIHQVVDKNSARYTSFLLNFATGFQETTYEMYRWLLLPVLSASPEELEEGIRYATVKNVINEHHTMGVLNPGNITQALKSTASLQVKRKITPIVLDYDQTSQRLHTVDRGFLIWLGHQDREELLTEAGLPVPQLAKQQRLPRQTAARVDVSPAVGRTEQTD